MRNVERKALPILLLCSTEKDSMVVSQGAIFNSARYPVIFASSSEEIQHHLESSGFDIAVLNHTLSFADRKKLAQQIKETDGDAGVLVLHASGALNNPHADIAVDSRMGPHAILLGLRRVEAMQAMRKSHAHSDQRLVVIVDKDRNYIYVSDAACELLGYDRVQFLELRIDDVVAGATTVAEPLFQQFVNDGTQGGVIVLRHRSGRLVEVRYSAEVRSDGSLLAYWHPISETVVSSGQTAEFPQGIKS